MQKNERQPTKKKFHSYIEKKSFNILQSYDPDTFQTYDHVKDKYKLLKKASHL